MVEKIAFQSIGGIEGIYLPSADNPKYGSLLTNYGILPAETSKQVRRTYSRFVGYPIAEEKGETKLKFLAWIIGTEKPPYYKFDLRSIHVRFPEWIKHNNWFALQGTIAERQGEKILLRMQKNYWQKYCKFDRVK